MIDTIQGFEPNNFSESYSLVYRATHDGAGNSLPLMNRSFISFSYGGRSIEDFGLIAITDGDAIQRDLYAKFNDNVSTYNALDGQFYWDSHYTTNSLELKLVTDGITEKELTIFSSYFKPGPAKELILAEHPNRAILARIAEPPQYEMLVFEKTINKRIGNSSSNIINVKTSTTLYKGFITLKFIMDDPFWYSKETLIDEENLENKPDKLKVIMEDDIPCKTMLPTDKRVFVGSKGYFNGNIINYTNINSGAALSALLGDACYLYYTGTAPGKPKLSFTITPVIDSSEAYIVDISYNDTQGRIWDGTLGARIKEGSNYGAYIFLHRASGGSIEAGETLYVREPKNSIYNEATNTTQNAFNCITVGENGNIFKFTTPSIYTGYNLAIKIFNEVKSEDSLIELRSKLRDTIKEYYSRAWAMSVVNFVMAVKKASNSNDALVIKGNDGLTMRRMMSFFLTNNDLTVPAASFIFDTKTGEAYGTFTIRKAKNIIVDNTTMSSIANDFNNATSLSGDIITITENVGDMIYDKYLTLEDINTPDDNMMIGENQCSKVTTDFTNGLNDFKIEYLYLYS